MRSIVLGTALALMATSAHAAFTIDPADTSPTKALPSGSNNSSYNPNFQVNGGDATPDAWSQGDNVYVGVDDVTASGGPSLPIRLEYLGFEAGDTNTVGVLFDTTGGSTSLTPIFATTDVTVDGIFIPGSASGDTFVDGSVLNVANFNSGDLIFRTFSNGSEQDTSLDSSNVALGFAGGATALTGDVLQIGLNDPFFTGDADFDDIRLAAAVVPLPAAVWMFGAGLAAVSGAAYRRRRAGATPAA